MKHRFVALFLAVFLIFSGCAAPAQVQQPTAPAVTAAPAASAAPAAPAATTAPAAPEAAVSDVLVIGAGLSGLCASVSAAQQGASVTLIEKLSFAGGNCILSTGILQGACSLLQINAKIEDSPETYLADMNTGEGAKRDPVQAKLVTSLSGKTIDWLVENGVDFAPEVKQGVGSTAFRAHQSSPDANELVAGLKEAAERAGVKIVFETAATDLITDANGAVVGARAMQNGKEVEYQAKAVVIATGGFGASKEMLTKYWGEKFAALTYAGSPGTTGEMIEVAAKYGAKLTDMEVAAYGSPTVEVTKNMLITAMVLSGGAFLTNAAGERFCNETGDPFLTANSVVETGEPHVFEIFDDTVAQSVYKISVYKNMGIVEQADTVEELATKVGLPADALQQTVESYNKAVDSKQDALGRTIFTTKMETAPFYCIRVAAGGVMTFGGLTIDEETRVLKDDGTVIEGLYSAGEATGGYRAYAYVCGDANAHAAVTGKVAGEKAAAFAK